MTGLTAAEVAQRHAKGLYNAAPEGVTPTIGKIVAKNTLTLFNLIYVALFVLILVAGGEIQSVLFIGVALSNTAMGIFQEWRSKVTLDRLSILAASKTKVLRDGQSQEIHQQDVVMDDIVILAAGEQICADAEVVYTDSLEVNEALLTGEQDTIHKTVGDSVMSGSFVVAGNAYVRVTAVGAGNFANSLTMEAKKFKKKTTPLMRTLNGIIRVTTIVIVPLGLLLFHNAYQRPGATFQSSILGTSTLVLGMIPAGLILLTGVTLALGAIKLARHKALVQSLPSIETLARVDVLCLDKTGTITDGTLSFRKFVLREGYSTEKAGQVLGEIMTALPDENATAEAIRGTFPNGGRWRAAGLVPFSSARKWSGVTFQGQGSYIIGAPQFVFPAGNQPFFKTVDKYAAEGYRVLCLAHSAERLDGDRLPHDLKCIGLLIFGDNIRPEAYDTFRRFTEEGVMLKVISGDDPVTVSTIAAKAGIDNANRYVDMSKQGENADFYTLVENYTVFGRVTPHQKRELVRALKRHGHSTCMTGDGVNDVLAMKEADCSVAMVEGSQAARNAADFVLLSSNFAAMVRVMKEGRRVINNIENVASIYLVNTIYFMLLGLIFAFVPLDLPIDDTAMMMPVSAAAIAVPTFFLAMRANYNKPRGRFLANVLENSVPAAIAVVTTILLVILAGALFDLGSEEVSTMNVLLIGTINFTVLARVARPFNRFIIALYAGCIAMFLIMFIGGGDFLRLEPLWSRNAFFYLPLMHLGVSMFIYLNRFVRMLTKKWEKRRQANAVYVDA